MSVNDGVTEYFTRLRRELPAFHYAEARRFTRMLTQNIAERTPIGRKIDPRTGEDLGPSGNARRGWRQRPVRREGDVYIAGSYNRVSYAGDLNYGTRWHYIVPKRAHVLRFFPAPPAHAFARRVRHPGTTGAFMMERGVRETERVYASEAEMRLRIFLERAERG
jgi:hypothetical protein